MTEPIDVEIKWHQAGEIGEWLDRIMPNPPLPDPQRWTVGYNAENTRVGVRFFNPKDALTFKLRWLS